MGSLSITHMIILFLIVLVIFGPKNLPKIGQALGRGIREFKDAARGMNAEMDDDDDRTARRRAELDDKAHEPRDTVSRSAAPPAEREPELAEPVRRTESVDLPNDTTPHA